MKVIAISGFKRSGKDTACDWFIRDHQAKRVAFADPLKEMAAKEFNIPIKFFNYPELKESPLYEYPVVITDSFIKGVYNLLKNEMRTSSGKQCESSITKEDGRVVSGYPDYEQVYWTPRALAIFKGSGNRAVLGSYWNKKAVEIIKNTNEDLYIIPDLRFKTEVEYLRNEFGKNLITVRLNRFDTVNTSDPSEIDLSDYKDWNYVLENKGTIEEFYNKLKEIKL